MSYIQLGDALEAVRRHYRSFVAPLAPLSTRSAELAQFVDRLVQAQAGMDQAITSFEDTVAESALNSWLQFFPDEQLVAVLDEQPPLQTLDELVAYFSRFNHELVELLELVRRATECEATQEVFERLATVQRQTARDLVWASRGQA